MNDYLCVNLEAASPGELKAGGAGWNIAAGFAESPFGRCLIAQSPRGICHLAFIDSADNKAEWAILQKHWPHARLQRCAHSLKVLRSRYAYGRRYCKSNRVR